MNVVPEETARRNDITSALADDLNECEVGEDAGAVGGGGTVASGVGPDDGEDESESGKKTNGKGNTEAEDSEAEKSGSGEESGGGRHEKK